MKKYKQLFATALMFLSFLAEGQSYQVCALKTGVMPEDSATLMGVNLTRRVISTSTWGGSGLKYTDSILQNINYSPTHEFTTDTATFKQKCIDIANTFRPKAVIIENEAVNWGSIFIYCNELKAAAHGLMPLGYRVTNSGFIQPHLWYWYYNKTQDANFLQANFFRQTQRDSLTNGLYQTIIDSVEYEMQVIMSLNLFAVDVHYYLGSATQSSGIIRMLNYVSSYTHRPVILTEAGIFTAGLLRNVVDVARSSTSNYLILYDGNDAGGNALNFTLAEYQAAIQP